MISRQQLEAVRDGYLARPIAAQREAHADTVGRIAAAIGDVASFEVVRDDVDRNMAYTEWTAHALDGIPLVKVVVDCHRLMGRLRSDWAKIQVGAELRGWVWRDVGEMRD